jgi:hypothetical protein
VRIGGYLQNVFDWAVEGDNYAILNTSLMAHTQPRGPMGGRGSTLLDRCHLVGVGFTDDGLTKNLRRT